MTVASNDLDSAAHTAPATPHTNGMTINVHNTHGCAGPSRGIVKKYTATEHAPTAKAAPESHRSRGRGVRSA